MATSIQVMILAAREEARQTLRTLLEFSDYEIAAEVKEAHEVVQRLTVVTPDVILVDTPEIPDDVVQMIEKVTMTHPGISVMVLSEHTEVSGVRRCMRAGAKDFLVKPVTVEMLTRAIQEVTETERVRKSRNTVAILTEGLTQKPHVVSFVSAKGGIGKTTIAVSTAAAFAKQGKRVVIVDLDLQFGDADLFLDLQPTRNIVDLIQEMEEADSSVMERYLTKHECGLWLLASPTRPEEAEYVRPAHVRTILQALKKKFDYIIVDTSPNANDVFFAVMDASDDCFMVSTLNLAVLKNNRALLDVLGDIGEYPRTIKHLLNRSNAKNGLKVKDVHRVLNTEIFAELDNDYVFVEKSINEGVPFVLRDEKHKLSKQIYLLTNHIEAKLGRSHSRRNPILKLIRSSKKSRVKAHG